MYQQLFDWEKKVYVHDWPWSSKLSYTQNSMYDFDKEDDTDELSSGLWLCIEMFKWKFLFWLDLDKLDDTDELSSALWLCIEMFQCIFLFWLDLDKLDDTDELSSGLWLCIEMFKCIFLFWLDLDELDDTDELSSGLRLCIDMFDVCNLTWTSWTTRTSCLLACDCVLICLMFVTSLGQVGRHGRVVFWPVIVYRYVWCVSIE